MDKKSKLCSKLHYLSLFAFCLPTQLYAGSIADALLAQDPCESQELPLTELARVFEHTEVPFIKDAGSYRFTALERICHPFDGCTEWAAAPHGVDRDRSQGPIHLTRSDEGVGQWEYITKAYAGPRNACRSSSESLWPCGVPLKSGGHSFKKKEVAQQSTRSCAKQVTLFEAANPRSPSGTVERAIILEARYNFDNLSQEVEAYGRLQQVDVSCNLRRWGHRYTCSGSYETNTPYTITTHAWLSSSRLFFVKADGNQGFDDSTPLGFLENQYELNNGQYSSQYQDDDGYYGAGKKRSTDITFADGRLRVRTKNYTNYGGTYAGCPTSGWETICEIAHTVQ